MLSKNQKFWNAFARYVQKPMLAMVAHQPTARLIADFNALLVYKTPRDLRMTPLKLTHDGTEIAATVCQSGPQPTGGTMLYLHGGAFMIGSLRMYRHLVASLARAANQRGVYLPYDLAPENAFPRRSIRRPRLIGRWPPIPTVDPSRWRGTVRGAIWCLPSCTGYAVMACRSPPPWSPCHRSWTCGCAPVRAGPTPSPTT